MTDSSTHSSIVNPAELLSVDGLLSYKLVRLQRLIDRSQTRNAEKFGLSLPEIRILFLLRRFRGKTLAEALRGTVADSGNSSRVVNRLVKSGLLTKQFDEDDGRKARLFLTAKGETLVDSALQEWHSFNETLLASIPVSEQQDLLKQLENLTAKIAHHLKSSSSDMG